MDSQKKETLGFKEGQEVLIYFDGTILESFPAQLSNVKNVEIIKEKSDIDIPEKILRFYNNSKNNVNITVNELTNDSITLSIVDKNDLSYNYSDNYKITREIKNEEYTGVRL